MAAGDEPRRRGDSEQTARRVVEAAAAEFVERGYAGAVISDIARRAGVTPGAIYPRWPHKSDLMAAAVDHLLEQLLPEQRLSNLGLEDSPAPDILAAWGANLLVADQVRDVLVQVFGSARNSAQVEEHLQRFLDKQAAQLTGLVESAKEEGFVDTGHDTAALVLLIQSAGIGTHLLISSGLSDQYVPSEANWVALIMGIMGSVEPRTSPAE